MSYDAFISYSHAGDGRLAPRVQSALHRFAKPLLSLRAMHVFRDQTSLAATPELWTTIVEALDQSRFFILMASPEAAESVWVQREVEHWLTRSPRPDEAQASARLLILLTDGEIVWSPAQGDFDWERTNALPRQLSSAFAEEPLHVDMRAVKGEDDLSLHNPRFRNQIADLAATIHGRPKDELIGEDVRIVRRNRRLAWSASIGLALLAIAATVMAVVATVQRDAARSRELAARAVSRLDVDAHESLELAVEAVDVAWTDEAASALREALLRSHLRARLSAPGLADELQLSHDGGRLLAVLCAEGETRCRLTLLNAVTGQPVCEIADAHAGRFIPDGSRIVTPDQRLFDATSCEPVAAGPGADPAPAEPDRPFQIVDVSGPAIREIETGAITRRLSGLRDPIGGAVFSADNRFVVTWSDESVYYESGGGSTEIGDKTVRVWGTEYSDSDAVLVGHDRATNTAVFSLDTSLVVTGSEDRTARVWLRRAGEPYAVLRGHPDGIRTVAVSPDNARVATVGGGDHVWLWAPGTSKQIEADPGSLFAMRYGVPMPALEGDEQPIVVPTLGTDGGTLVAAVSPSAVGVWDVATGNRRALLTNESYGDISGRPCPEGSRVVTINSAPRVTAGDEAALLWDVESETVIATLESQDGPVFGAACSPDGATIATASEGGTIRMWDGVTLEKLREIDVGEGGRILGLNFSRDGTRLVTAHRDAVARVWDTRTGGLTLALSGHSGGVLNAVFSPDDSLIVTVGDDRTRVWDAGTGKQVGDYVGSGEGTVFVAHDCLTLAVADYGDQRVRIHEFGACGPNDEVLARALARIGLVDGI